MAYALNSDLDDEHREEIQCAACSRMFEDPTTLPCRHSFCKVCLADIVGRHRNEESLDRVFSCPECGSEFILKSDETVANVQPTSDEVKETAELDPGSGIPCAHECESQSVARCVTCEKYLCRECLTAHNNYRGNKGHSVLSVEGLSKHKNHLKKERKMFCSKFGHENRALKFYCETCETFICRYCMDFSHEKQEGHICRLAKEVAQKNRDSLVASYANLKNLLEEGETFLKQLSFVTKKVEKHAEDAKTEFAERKQTIVKWFSDSLEKRSKKLNAEIDEIQGRKLQTLKQHEDKTKRYVTSIQECVQTSTKLLDETTDEDIISLQKLAKESEEKLGQQRSTYFKLPVTDLDVHYSDFTIRSPSMDAILDQAKLLMGKIRVPDDIPNPELQIVEFKRPSNYESEKISQVVEAQDHLRYQPRATASSNENTSQKGNTEESGVRERSTTRSKVGFRGLTRANVNIETEDQQREKEHNDVKAFIDTLDEQMVRKLAIRSLRRGIGSMDYIHTLLIAEDDLDEDTEDLPGWDEEERDTEDTSGARYQQSQDLREKNEAAPPWCVCSNCKPMPQDIENKCCKQKKCITSSSRFGKICLDPDVLELCIRNTSDIRNDREDNSTRAFRKAAYRQFILARHGFLGKGNRRVCPSCVVLKIRQRYPSVTGVYMGYREH